MSWQTHALRIAVRVLGRDALAAGVGEALAQAMAGLDRPQRVAFLQDLATRGLTPALAELDRADRARLMNDLLPLVAQEFPLDELDLLSAFGGAGT